MEYRSKDIYINLPVLNLEKTIDFFTELGFAFDPKLTDQYATCMVIGDHIFAMFLAPDYFRTFTKKGISNSFTSTEVILTVTVDTREKVDLMVNRALAAGAKPSIEQKDHGSMYWSGFEDINGHLWEVMYGEEGNLPT
jgi:hypothetical protein